MCHGLKCPTCDPTLVNVQASLLARQEMLGSASSLLKSVAESYQIPVVATNQVAARIGEPAGHTGAVQGGLRTAALGL